ncbi:MAG: FAD-binding oxidoreductase [Nitriliruptorales bacterium]|nr:FAD-binding oxidoreductase [Nitriliruptorales bacterium]
MDTPRPAWIDTAEVGVPPLSSLRDPATAEVCVIGLGASGLAAARRLAERGADVLALDAVGIAAGAAGANGGFLLAGTALFHHDAVRRLGRERTLVLHRATVEELEHTAAEEPSVRRTGSLRIAADDAELADIGQHVVAMRADGLPAEEYSGPEGAGLLVPGDAVFQPADRCRRLARAAMTAGARLVAPVRVASILTEHDRVELTTDAAPIVARRVIVAVDGGLEELLEELADEVVTHRLQMLATGPDEDVTLTRPVYRRWGWDYVQQLDTGEVLLGGGRDVDDDVTGDAVPSTPVQEHLDRELVRLGVTAPVTHRWAAHAAFTEDRLPICREVRPNVLVVGAYSGHGNLVGPLLARRAADVALDAGALTLPA